MSGDTKCTIATVLVAQAVVVVTVLSRCKPACSSSALDWEHGGRRLVELADRLGRTEAAVRQRAARLRAGQLEGDLSTALAAR